MKRFICTFLILSMFGTSAAWCADSPPLMLNPITMQSAATGLGIYTGRNLMFSNFQLNRTLNWQLALHRRINIIKGNIGESVMHTLVTSQSGGRYVRVNAQLGSTARQGIDGLYVRYNKQGAPSQILVGEAKYGSSQLGQTADGPQMSETWINKRLIQTANRFNIAANDIDSGKIQRSPTKAPAGNSSQSQIRLNNKRTVQIWKENGTWKYHCDGQDVSPAELAARLRTHAILFKNAGNGVVDVTRGRVYRINLSGNKPVIEVYRVDSSGNEIRGSRKTVNTSSLSPETRELFRENMRETLIGEYQRAGINEQQAIKMVDKELANKSSEQILKMHAKNPLLSSRFLFHNVFRSSLYGSAISAGIAGLMQLVTEGKVDAKGLAMGALTGGAAAGIGQLAGNVTVILANTETGKNIVNWFANSPLHLSGRLGMFLSTLPGAAVTSVLFSYGMYLLGLTDLRTANRSVISGLAGAAGSSLFVSATMSTAMLVGTASTGTAISTLSGAAATKAALAWLGHGAISAGGFGVAGGTILLSTGAILIAIPCYFLTDLYFRIKDEKAEIARIRTILDAAYARI